MQFVVPQFIDVEDKIFGPLSVRQFIISVVGIGVLFVEFRLADFSLFLIEAILTVLLVLIFAFVRVNGRPFHHFLLNVIQTTRRPRMRVWRRTVDAQEMHLPKVSTPQKRPVVVKQALSASRLSELALVVDTGGAYRKDELSPS